jgi:hypothetical protein
MKVIVALASVMVSAQAYSATTIGSLTYDETTNLITSTSGTQYLGFDVLAGYTYQETVQATASGGAYEQFHIASQQEAFQFYYDLSGSNATLQPDMNGVNSYSKIVSSINQDGLFGANANSIADTAWFLAKESKEVGLVKLSNYNTRAEISDGHTSIVVSDFYTASGKHSDQAISWLLVSNSTISAVPVPSAAFLFAPVLIGFMGLRGKQKHKK